MGRKIVGGTIQTHEVAKSRNDVSMLANDPAHIIRGDVQSDG